MNSRDYWREEGASKTFTHEIVDEWLEPIDRTAAILDLGCGYGRIAGDLYRRGYTNIVGYDISEPLLARARRLNGGPLYTASSADLDGRRFALVLCVAIFTSCPESDEQQALAGLIEGVSGPGTMLYVSDCLMADNPHYQARYRERRLGVEGCFSSGQRGLFRHHGAGHFEKLFEGWEKRAERAASGTTLSGNEVVVRRYLFRRQGNQKK